MRCPDFWDKVCICIKMDKSASLLCTGCPDFNAVHISFETVEQGHPLNKKPKTQVLTAWEVTLLTFDTGYESDSESCLSDVAEDIVMQVIGSDNETRGSGGKDRITQPKERIPQQKEKENVRPVETKGRPITRLTSKPTTASDPQTLASSNREVKKGKSVRFSISPSSTPSPRKSATPPPRLPLRSPPKSPPKARTLPASSRAGGMAFNSPPRAPRAAGMGPRSPPRVATVLAGSREGGMGPRSPPRVPTMLAGSREGGIGEVASRRDLLEWKQAVPGTNKASHTSVYLIILSVCVFGFVILD